MRLRIVAVRLPTVSLSPGPAFIRPAESACRTCWLCPLGVTSSPWKRWNRLMDKRASRPGLSDIHKRSSALSSGGAMRNLLAESALTLWLFVECSDAKKYCWYFEGGYPIYFICRSYEDCCGTRCCVRALSIHRLWYFWVLLMMGLFFCCGAGFFIRRRMYPSPLRDDPAFNVSFTRHPATSPVSQQPGSIQGYGVNGMAGGEPGVTVPLPVYPAQPASAHKMMAPYPPPPSYCNHPPPPYEQVFQNSDKK